MSTAASSSSTATHAEKLAQRTIHTLMNDFGFALERCREAVEAIGDKGDVSLAISWLLDHGEQDRGGAIALKRCPHLDYADGTRPLAHPSRLRFGCPCKEGCSGGENWICLFCGETHCSRYVNGHSLAHWRATRDEEERALTVADAAQGKQALGHHLALSLSDLSVWCYACEAYIEHDAILPHCEAVRAQKFGEGSSSAAPSAAPPKATAANVAVGDPLEAPAASMHGTKGDPKWAAPRVTVACATPARPGYRTCAAHEYQDGADVLLAKAKQLATMLRASTHASIYTGAGISTASGINDYATKARTLERRVHPLLAAPSYSHRALAEMHAAGLFRGGWVQQNHDGLPQKAGMPQAALNEIHGAWFDPSNPVVPMDGTLRGDLIFRLEETIARTDLCLAAGSSLCGMNADRVVTATARRARRDPAVQGAVIINLQRTVLDSDCQLRIFAPIDEVLRILADELALSVPEQPPAAACAPPVPRDPAVPDVFEVPCEGGDGRRATTTLDLRAGALVQISGQPDWDAERCGTVGVVTGKDALGNYVIKLQSGGDRAVRTLGAWWIREAQAGSVEAVPVAPLHSGH